MAPQARRGAPERAASPTRGALLDPGLVILILVLAGIFDGISGNPIHSILLFAAAVALVFDGLRRRTNGVEHATRARGTGAASQPGEVLPAQSRPDPRTVAMAGAFAIAYSVLVGGFGRYSAPATAAVIAPGAVALAIAWRQSARPRPAPGAVSTSGKVVWASVFVAGGLWELSALLLQPTLTTDSYAHPTLSVLTDPILAAHPGRSVALFLWLAFGWFLLGR